MRLVWSESDEFSKSYHQSQIKFSIFDPRGFDFMKKQSFSAKTSRFQLQLLIQVRKYGNSTCSKSSAINCHFCSVYLRNTRKNRDFDVKLVFSTMDACSWYVLVELNECYRMSLVFRESDEFSKSYHQSQIKFLIQEDSITRKNSRFQRKLLYFNYN